MLCCLLLLWPLVLFSNLRLNCTYQRHCWTLGAWRHQRSGWKLWQNKLLDLELRFFFTHTVNKVHDSLQCFWFLYKVTGLALKDFIVFRKSRADLNLSVRMLLHLGVFLFYKCEMCCLDPRNRRRHFFAGIQLSQRESSESVGICVLAAVHWTKPSG